MSYKQRERKLMNKMLKDIGVEGGIPKGAPSAPIPCPYCGNALEIYFEATLSMKMNKVTALPKGMIKKPRGSDIS